MHGGTVGEYDGRAQCRARPRITASHHRCHVIAAGIETWDRLSVVRKNARVRVCRKPRTDRDVGRPNRKRIEGRLDQRPYTRVRLVIGIAVEAVQLGFAFAEIDVDTGLGKPIVARDRVTQLPCINTNPVGKFSKIRRADNVPVVDELFGVAMTGIDHPQTISPQKRGIADQPGRDRRCRLRHIQTWPVRSRDKRPLH